MKIRKALKYPRMERRDGKIIIARLDPRFDIGLTRQRALRC